MGAVEVDTGDNLPQLLHINLRTKIGMHGSSLECYLSRAIQPWILAQPDDYYHPRLEDAMRRVGTYMMGASRFTNFDLSRAWFRKPNWVNLVCPGDRCGLYTEYGFHEGGEEGYLLVPHNVDNVDQQLMLLAALAKMHEEARAFGC